MQIRFSTTEVNCVELLREPLNACSDKLINVEQNWINEALSLVLSRKPN